MRSENDFFESYINELELAFTRGAGPLKKELSEKEWPDDAMFSVISAKLEAKALPIKELFKVDAASLKLSGGMPNLDLNLALRRIERVFLTEVNQASLFMMKEISVMKAMSVHDPSKVSISEIEKFDNAGNCVYIFARGMWFKLEK